MSKFPRILAAICLGIALTQTLWSQSAPSGGRERTWEMGVESLFESDFVLSQSTLNYRTQSGERDWSVTLRHHGYELDVQSPDPFFSPKQIDENQVAIQGEVGFPLHPRFKLKLHSGYYDGFSDYRSAWLYEYYRQIGNLPGFGGYPSIEPHGFQLGVGFRWEYLPASGFLDGSISIFRDWIVPSAEFQRTTILGRRTINTQIYSLGTENVLNERMRSRFQIQLADTSARDLRVAIQGSLNIAIGQDVVLRSELGWVEENPSFESVFVGMSWEYEWTPEWWLSWTARYYHDTGEIQDSLPANNAPPGLESLQVGVGLRYVKDPHTVKLYVAPYLTSYEATDDAAPFFKDLYRSREWGIFQLAYAFRF